MLLACKLLHVSPMYSVVTLWASISSMFGSCSWRILSLSLSLSSQFVQTPLYTTFWRVQFSSALWSGFHIHTPHSLQQCHPLKGSLWTRDWLKVSPFFSTIFTLYFVSADSLCSVSLIALSNCPSWVLSMNRAVITSSFLLPDVLACSRLLSSLLAICELVGQPSAVGPPPPGAPRAVGSRGGAAEPPTADAVVAWK